MNSAASEQNSIRLPFFGITKIWPYILTYKRNLLIIAVGGLASLLDATVPLFQKYVLEHFIAQQTFDTIIPFILLFLAVLLAVDAVNFVVCYLSDITESSVNRDLRNRVFKHLQHLSLSFYNQNSIGKIHSRLMSDTSRIGSLVTWSLLEAIWHIGYLVSAGAIMLWMNLRLGSMILLIVPILLILLLIFQRRLEQANHEMREINAAITGDFNESITGAKTIKTLAIERTMYDDFARKTTSMFQTSVRTARLKGVFSAAMHFATSSALALMLWQGGVIAAEDVGMFAAFISYASGMMEPVRWFVNAISSLISTQVNIERVTQLLKLQPEVVDSPEVVATYGDTFAPKKENWEPMHGDVEFQNVTFRYPDGQENVLENFSLKIPFGSHIAIVGETGAGKSTIVNLVCRFFEPTDGHILIDGRDMRERSILWLHSNIGCVLQTPHLFSGSIRENLLMGNPEATDEQINEALKIASADEVVARLEHGLDTDVGEGGDQLSTGERQLISFARAIIANPRILILDEATSSVDTMTEAKIQAIMKDITKDRTTIMIAHRLSTVRDADWILVIRDGKIVEQGTHDNLLRLNGYYATLYTRQYEDEAASEILV